jgi:hypothetical protein
VQWFANTYVESLRGFDFSRLSFATPFLAAVAAAVSLDATWPDGAHAGPTHLLWLPAAPLLVATQISSSANLGTWLLHTATGRGLLAATGLGLVGLIIYRAVACWMGAPQERATAPAVGLALVVTVTFLTISSWSSARMIARAGLGSNHQVLYEDPALLALSAEQRAEPRPFRVASVAHRRHPGYAWAYGLETVDGYTNLYAGSYKRFWLGVLHPLISREPERFRLLVDGPRDNQLYLFAPESIDGLRSAAILDWFELDRLSLANVRFLISHVPLSDPRLRLWRESERTVDETLQRATRPIGGTLASDESVPGTRLYVYENAEVVDRYRVVCDIAWLGDEHEVGRWIEQRDVRKLAATVPLLGSSGVRPPAFDASRLPTLEMLTRSSDRVEATVTDGAGCAFVVANTFSRFWTATVNDERRPVHQSYGTFQAVLLTSDKDRVVLRYRPPYVL